MFKKFPILFPELLADFELIKGSSDAPDETDYEWFQLKINIIY